VLQEKHYGNYVFDMYLSIRAEITFKPFTANWLLGIKDRKEIDHILKFKRKKKCANPRNNFQK
jgi:hypothetical protein